MLTPSLNTVMTRLLIVAAVLATLVFFAPAIFDAEFAQADETMMYAENGTDAVRTFTSTDPEGAGIDWDVTGLDADDTSRSTLAACSCSISRPTSSAKRTKT